MEQAIKARYVVSFHDEKPLILENGTILIDRDKITKVGVNLDPSKLPASVVEAAKDMTPLVRAENAEGLRAALLQAKEVRAAEVAKASAKAREVKTYVHSGNTAHFAQGAERSLMREGFDLSEMPQVQKRLRKLKELPQKDPAAIGRRVEDATFIELENFQTIQNQIENKE